MTRKHMAVRAMVMGSGGQAVRMLMSTVTVHVCVLGIAVVIAAAPQPLPPPPPPNMNICAANHSIGAAVINAVNLSWPGMEDVREAWAGHDLGSACELLASYYRKGNTSAWLRLPRTPKPSARRAGGDADDLVQRDVFHLSGVEQVARIPRNKDGGLDWTYHGPKNDPEFMNCLNRHEAPQQLFLVS